MPKMKIMPLNREVEAPEGKSILQSMLDAGIRAPFRCGQADCGTCHVFVLEGRKSLSKIERAEHGRLDAVVGVGSKSRLACQAILGREDIVVELPGFASGG